MSILLDDAFRVRKALVENRPKIGVE